MLHSEPDSPVLLHAFPTFAVGGAQVRFAAIANRFGKAYRHLIIALDGNYECQKRLSPGLDVDYMAVEFRKSRLPVNVFAFRRLLRTLGPDVLVTYNWGSMEWALANIPPLARHVHIEDGFGPEERIKQLRRRVLTRRIALARSIVAVPSRNLYRIATGVWRLNERRLRYIPNGIDLLRYDGVRNPLGQAAFPGNGPVIGTVTVLRSEKNVLRLVQAFQLVSQTARARLVIVGDGPERDSIETLVRDLGLESRVSFTGYLSDLAHIYAAFDIFAMSSDTEQMPLTVIEAMAAGLPIASTDVGDIRAMVAPESQQFVVASDASALAGSLSRLLHDETLRKNVGAANRVKALNDFDQEKMFAAYARLFNGTE